MSDSVEDALREAMAAADADTPPRARTPPPVEDEAPGMPERDPRKLTPKWKALHSAVTDLYTAGQMAAYALGDYDTAAAIANNTDACAMAWVELAQKDKRVEGWLHRLTTGSAWGGVIMTHAALLLPILAKKGILPGGALFGGFAPKPDETAAPQDSSLFDGYVAATNGADAS